MAAYTAEQIRARQEYLRTHPLSPAVGMPAPAPRAARTRSRLQALVVLAACTLREPFTTEALAVACWRVSPLKFGLDGFTEHPDVHRVRCHLYGARSLVAQGLLERVDEGTYRVTAAGREAGRNEP